MAAIHTETPPQTRATVVDFGAKNAGLLLVICSQFFAASMNLSVKLLESLHPPTPALELITIRMAITVVCCWIYTVANKIPDPFFGPRDVRGLLILRGISGFLALFGIYYALNYLSLADTTAITFLSPFSIAFVGYLLLGESYTNKDALAGICSLFGVVLITRPSFLFGIPVEDYLDTTSFERLRAVGSALLAVGGLTGIYAIIRAIGTRAHPAHVMLYFALVCVTVGSIVLPVFMREFVVFPMTLQWIALLLTITIFGSTSQILLIIGLRRETATRASLGSYTQLLFAVVLERIVFGTVPSISSVAGAAIIFTAQTYTVFSKRKLAETSEGERRPLLSGTGPSGETNLQSNGGEPV